MLDAAATPALVAVAVAGDEGPSEVHRLPFARRLHCPADKPRFSVANARIVNRCDERASNRLHPTDPPVSRIGGRHRHPRIFARPTAVCAAGPSLEVAVSFCGTLVLRRRRYRHGIGFLDLLDIWDFVESRGAELVHRYDARYLQQWRWRCGFPPQLGLPVNFREPGYSFSTEYDRRAMPAGQFHLHPRKRCPRRSAC